MALYHCQFQQFLYIQSEYGDLMSHKDVRWLSWGSTLQRFLSHSWEISRQYLAEMGQPMQEMSDTEWMADFAFMVEITEHLNSLICLSVKNVLKPLF